jgi:hypothetical protein
MAEYRKFLNGKEFMKLQDGKLLSVLLMADSVRVLCTTNRKMIEDFHNEDLTSVSSYNEFSKQKSKAFFEISETE